MGARKRHGGGKGSGDKAGKAKRGRRKRKLPSGSDEISPSSGSDFSETELSEAETPGDGRQKPKKIHPQVPARKSGAKPVLVVVSLLMFVGLSTGIYLYNFGDLNLVIETLQSRAASFMESWSEEKVVAQTNREADSRSETDNSAGENNEKDSRSDKLSEAATEPTDVEFDGSDVVSPGAHKSKREAMKAAASLEQVEEAVPVSADKMKGPGEEVEQQVEPAVEPEIVSPDKKEEDRHILPENGVETSQEERIENERTLNFEDELPIDIDLHHVQEEIKLHEADQDDDQWNGDKHQEEGETRHEEGETHQKEGEMHQEEGDTRQEVDDTHQEEGDTDQEEDETNEDDFDTSEEDFAEEDVISREEEEFQPIEEEKAKIENNHNDLTPKVSDSVEEKQPSPPQEESQAGTGQVVHETVNEKKVASDATSDPPEKLSEPVPETKISEPPYAKADITNEADFVIKKKLDIADNLVEKERPTDALTKYRALQEKHPNSPRAQYGVAWSLDVLSELERSNVHLEQCITEYIRVLSLSDVPRQLMMKAGKRAADRQSFRGWGGRAIKTIKLLLDLFPDELNLWNELGVQNLMFGRNEEGRYAFQKVLEQNPDDGFALAHLGFIIKTNDRDAESAIPYLMGGILSEQPGTQDGRFFFHLGDALHRLGRSDEAYEIYARGVKQGLFRSIYQRSLYNVDKLTGRPWWTAQQTGNKRELQILEDNWKTIRDEGLAQLDTKTGVFVLEDEDLRDTGEWRQFTLFSQGRKDAKNCKKAPKTCALMERFTEAVSCTRGQIKYSVMQPGVHVWPHCGPTNCRIRSHLGLVIPDGPSIRVATETKTWQEGKFLIFDDSFEHEVWHNGTSFRMVLIVDMWHPELTSIEKRTLSPI